MKMISHISLYLLISWAQVSPIFAQQLPYFYLFQDVPTQVNPASLPLDMISDDDNAHRIVVQNRTQWLGLGFDQLPQTSSLEYDYFFKTSDQIDWMNGSHIVYDRNGRFSQLGLYGRTSAQFVLSQNNLSGPRLSIGISSGLVNYRLNVQDARVASGGSTPLTGFSDWKADFGFGVYYIHPLPWSRWKGSNKIYIGLSVPQTLGRKLSLENSSVDKDLEFSYSRYRHYYANLGGSIRMGYSGNFKIEPSIWFKYVPKVPMHVDLTCRFTVIDKYRFGVGYSTSKMASVSGGLRLNPKSANGRAGRKVYYVNYGFGYQLGALQSLGTSHELALIFHW